MSPSYPLRVAASFAQSIDGKIATVQHPRLRLGSSVDLSNLKRRRESFDAVLVGGRTFSAWPIPYASGFPIHNLVLSRQDLSAQIQNAQRWPEAKVELHMLTPEGSYPKGVHWYDGSKGIQSVLDCCQTLGIKRLLIEGGGGLLSEFISHSMIHELFVTLCPSLVGGQNSPSSCDGTTLNPPVDYQLLSVDRVDNELYLHYGHRSIAVD